MGVPRAERAEVSHAEPCPSGGALEGEEAGLRDAKARRRGWRPAELVRRSLAGVWRDHRLIAIAVALAVLVRVLAMLAFRPALFTPDSFSYLSEALHPRPGTWHPAGYPILLFLLLPFHSLLLVTFVQHLTGIAIAVLGYALLRRWGLPAWGAVLAMSPVLFDSRQVALESLILPDVLYEFVLMLAVVLLLTRRKLTAGRCALAGLLLAGAALTRGNGIAEIVAVLAVLLIQRAGWQAITAAAVAFAVPVLAYMGCFAALRGNFALTNSDGMFLWSRTMTFANCAVIRPPADLRPLCPDRQRPHPASPAPAWSLTSALAAPAPAAYLWAPSAWWRHDAHPGFSAANNTLAKRFALAAIRAQPADYLRTVAGNILLGFVLQDRLLTFRTLHFTRPEIPVLNPRQLLHLRKYAHITSNTRPVQPYAYFLYLYQEPVYFPGIAFALVIITGLAGVIRNWRQRGAPPALPWLVAAVGILTPVAVHQYGYRYMIPLVPVACLAAALAFARGPAQAKPMTSTAPASPETAPTPLPAQPALVRAPAATPASEQAKPPGDPTAQPVQLPSELVEPTLGEASPS
jgi:hypothetical protein